jgi:hypothetical protein
MVVMWKIILTLQRKMWQIIKYFSMHGPLLLGKLNSPIGSRAGYIPSEWPGISQLLFPSVWDFDIAITGRAIFCFLQTTSPATCRHPLLPLSFTIARLCITDCQSLVAALCYGSRPPLTASRWCSSMSLLHQISIEHHPPGQIWPPDLEKMTPAMDWSWGSPDLPTGNLLRVRYMSSELEL